jgi:ABC-type phosphate/phosphonate transport system ATPase subunit
MALSFPWSRWRALLLDDPLQYSDIVHTSNLIEVLRLLALQHGFQIFLSTHERDLADYVVRKFKNAGLRADRVVFRESSEGGGGVPILLQ